MIETSSVSSQKSSVSFGYLRKSLGKLLGNVRLAFGTILESLRKVVGNLRKIVRNVLLVYSYNKQNIMLASGYEFYLLVFNSISQSFTALTREISSWNLEDKIDIHARACECPLHVKLWALWLANASMTDSSNQISSIWAVSLHCLLPCAPFSSWYQLLPMDFTFASTGA